MTPRDGRDPLETPRAAPLPDVPSAESVVREVDGLDLHVVAAGDEGDPLAVLLHGFPEFWYGWSKQVEPLVEAGFRVLVPDQRGYNRSDRPQGTRPYRLPRLSRDVADLVAGEGRDAAHVVGHDWGAVVAWDLALRRPDVVDRLGIVNVPHPTVFRRTLRSNPRQMLKSWYVFLFQVPRLPEWLVRRRDFAPWVAAMRGKSDEGAFTDEDLRRYRRAWTWEGAPTAMINWYRALTRHGEAPPRTEVEPPTLVVWGERDLALVPEMAPASLDHCRSGELERFPEATHWIHHERPDEVAGLLVDHLRG